MPAYMFCLEKFLNREEFLFDNVILSNFLILFLTCNSTYQMPWNKKVSFKDSAKKNQKPKNILSLMQNIHLWLTQKS